MMRSYHRLPVGPEPPQLKMRGAQLHPWSMYTDKGGFFFGSHRPPLGHMGLPRSPPASLAIGVIAVGAIVGWAAARWYHADGRSTIPLVQSPEELGYTIGDLVYEMDSYDVHYATQEATGRSFAAQVTKTAESALSSLVLEEVRSFRHPVLIRLHDVFATRAAVFEIVDPVFSGNDLFEFVANSPGMKLSERQAAIICEQLLQALAYIHAKGLVHRNVRPDASIFIAGKDEMDPSVRLGNYSLMAAGTSADHVGAPGYVPPEMHLGRRYGSQVDLWALGVTLHVMLTGNLPFDHSDPARLRDLICGEELSFRGTVWQGISPGAMDLTMALLNKDPDRRCTAAQALTHPWIIAKGDLPREAGGCCGGKGGSGGGGCGNGGGGGCGHCAT